MCLKKSKRGILFFYHYPKVASSEKKSPDAHVKKFIILYRIDMEGLLIHRWIPYVFPMKIVSNFV